MPECNLEPEEVIVKGFKGELTLTKDEAGDRVCGLCGKKAIDHPIPEEE